MSDLFSERLRAAAVAGWWTILIAYCILIIQWLAYILIMHEQSARIIYLLGDGITWQELRAMWLWAMVISKIIFGTMLFVVIWLLLWARQLRKE